MVGSGIDHRGSNGRRRRDLLSRRRHGAWPRHGDPRSGAPYGYDDRSKPIPPGGSLVAIALAEEPGGTRLHLRHDFADSAARDQLAQGWRYQLAVFANVVAREQHTRVAERVDAYFALWSEPDPQARARGLAEIAIEDVVFHDAFSCTSGLTDLTDHLAAAQAHMPGVRFKRTGEVRQCQGTAVAE